MNRDLLEEAGRFRQALEIAAEEASALPLSTPGPIRDAFTMNLMEALLRRPHQSRNCEQCLGMAQSMAMVALGWTDLKATRADTVQERMNVLMEQMDIALVYLDKLHNTGRDAG